jgi:ferredoxin--NADP+ reductase/vanillate O-demethylase ferredoxin subunit
LSAVALRTRVGAIAREAATVVSLELHPVAGEPLPRFTAGAHVDLHLGNGQIRSYSLFNPQDETHRYRVAVHLDPGSRGGSRYVHEKVRVGDEVRISPPRNNFALVESAAHSVLVAGGIGITPLLCMVQRLDAVDASWRLFYAARSRRHAPFIDALERFGSRVAYHFDDEAGRPPDLAPVIGDAAAGTHLYCCGPAAMLTAFESACVDRPVSSVHTERFSGSGDKAVGGFEVVLAKAGRSIAVPQGASILEALLDAGIDVPHSCTEGVCGSCETTVLEGSPDHRDLLLTEEEKRAGRTMIICCSGSRTPRLVLDL